MAKPKLLTGCVLFSLCLSPLFADADLVIVEGQATHSPDLGVEPPLTEDLVKKAQEDAQKKLGNAQAFMQVSSWQTNNDCTPTFRGSPYCYQGKAVARASFVEREKMSEMWRVSTSGSKHWHRANEGDTSPEAMTEAYETALSQARFFCNGEVELPAIDVKTIVKDNVMEWQCMLSTWEGKFRCKK